MRIDPRNLHPDFVKTEQLATGNIGYIIQYPDWITLKETRMGVTEVQIHCEIPSDVPGRQIKIITHSAELHAYVRNLNDSIPVLHVRTASLVMNYYEFHYVRAFDMVMLPKEKYPKGFAYPVYVVDIKFHCLYYKKMEKSSGMRHPTVDRFQLAFESDDNAIEKSNYRMEILDPAEEHD